MCILVSYQTVLYTYFCFFFCYGLCRTMGSSSIMVLRFSLSSCLLHWCVFICSYVFFVIELWYIDWCVLISLVILPSTMIQYFLSSTMHLLSVFPLVLPVVSQTLLIILSMSILIISFN